MGEPTAADEGTPADVASWLEIVREVEPLFGPMPDFRSALLRNIRRGTALCVRDANGQVLGGALMQAPPRTVITWLAVRASARRHGVGQALVAEALRRWRRVWAATSAMVVTQTSPALTASALGPALPAR